jgi:hypothetical protein
MDFDLWVFFSEETYERNSIIVSVLELCIAGALPWLHSVTQERLHAVNAWYQIESEYNYDAASKLIVSHHYNTIRKEDH